MRQIIAGAVLVAAPLLLAPAPAAQDDGHVVEVRSLVSRDAVRPGEIFKAAVILKVQAGFHVNDHAPLDAFMIPTEIAVEDGQDCQAVEFFYPAGRRARFSYAEDELSVYDGEVVLGVLLRAKEGLAPGAKVLRAALSYQACDEGSCLAPRELAFDIAVPVVSAESEGREVHPEIFGKIRFRASPK